MASTFTCPFCKQPLVQVIPNIVLTCNTDGVILDLSRRTASITEKAPKHLQESYKFLKEFETHDIFAAFSSHKLWDVNFSCDEVLAVGDVNSDVIRIKPAGRVNYKKLKDMHIIAGQHLIAEDLVKYTLCALHDKSQNNPLIFEKTPSADQWLYRKILLQHASTDAYSAKNLIAVNAYFAPTIERMLQTIIHPFEAQVLPDITDEEALCSVLTKMPQMLIGWGKDADDLLKINVKYINSILRDIDKIDSQVPKETSVRPALLKANPNMWNDMFRLFLSAMSETYINNQDTSKDPVIFDILNQHWYTDPFASYDVTKLSTQDVLTIVNGYAFINVLVNKCAANDARFGIECKKRFLESLNIRISEMTTDNEMVLLFWKEVKKYAEPELKEYL